MAARYRDGIDDAAQPPPYPMVSPDRIGWISTAQMVEVDRVMIDDLGIELLQMMENAGRHLARVVIDLYRPRSVAVYVGSGGNGGGGLVAARHLANWGVDVAVVAARQPAEMAGVPRHQLQIVEKMGVEIGNEPVEADVLVDGLIGYSLAGAPRGLTRDLIVALTTSNNPVVALDVPSGLDSTTGAIGGEVVDAVATLTLAMPKAGLRDASQVGRLFVADISVPPFVYERMGLVGEPPQFVGGPVVEVRPKGRR